MEMVFVSFCLETRIIVIYGYALFYFFINTLFIMHCYEKCKKCDRPINLAHEISNSIHGSTYQKANFQSQTRKCTSRYINHISITINQPN